MDEKRRVRSNMAVSIILAIVILLAVLGVIVSWIGYVCFSGAFDREYSTSTYHMAKTAANLVNGDHLAGYLFGQYMDEYQETSEDLDAFCTNINVSLIYVIMVDQTDYNSFVSVFNEIDNAVDNTEYEEWELGRRVSTTNGEYRRKYQSLYEEGADYEIVYRTERLGRIHPHITTIVPVFDSRGRVAGLLCIQRPIREMDDARRPYLWQVGVSTTLLAIMAALLAVMFLRIRVVAPISKISGEAARFARENTIGDTLEDIGDYDVIQDLAGSIEKMETDMVNYIDNLTAVTAERERIGAELSFATRIQSDAIPNVFPAFPDRKDFDIYASMTPAKEVGGDFYNFYLIDDDHLALVIGDVSGKGVPAALFMMITNIMISDRTNMGGSPAEIMTFVNRNLCKNTRSDMFVTVWLGIIELSTGRLTSVNAGHEDIVVCRNGGEFELLKTRHGVVAAALDTVCYTDEVMTLNKGDRLFIYTDGIPEAVNADSQMYGLKRMVETLNRYKDGSLQEIIEGVKSSVDEFSGEAAQFDDITMLCFERKL